MMKRKFGSTQTELSAVGFSGIIVDNLEQSEANRYVQVAIDAGINYFDVAPSYGNAEMQLGPALKPFRKDLFLSCKTMERTKEGALKELENSLRNMATDHFDLYQLHAMTTEEDFSTAVGPNGALEGLIQAQREGKIGYIGFSAHSVPTALKLIDSFEFNSVMLPINFATWLNGGFGLQVVEKARQKGMAVIALKGMAKTLVAPGETKPYERCWYVPIDDSEYGKLAFRWTLSQDITAAMPPGDFQFFKTALEAATDFRPVSAEEEEKLKTYAQGLEPLFTA